MMNNFYFTSTGPENLYSSSKVTTDNGNYISNYTNTQDRSCNPKNTEIKISSEEKVNHPSHYTWLKKLCGIEVIDITRHMNFNLGNVIKYVLRSGHKSEEGMSDKQKRIEDLKKAVFYLNDEINRIENDKEGI